MPRAKKRQCGVIVPVEPVWVGKEDAMRLLSCGENYLNQLRYDAKIGFAQEGKKIWYEVKSLNRYIEKHRIV